VPNNNNDDSHWDYPSSQVTLGEGVNVAYIDLHADNQDGYIRCTDAESAKTICEKSADGFKFNLVKGMLNDR